MLKQNEIFVNKDFFKLSKNILFSKYSKNLPDKYNLRVINNILSNRKKHYVTLFKEHLINDEISEFLHRFYFHKESVNKFAKIINYFRNKSLIYPNCSPLSEYKYIYSNLKKKERILQRLNPKYINKIKSNKKDIDSPFKMDFFNENIYDDILNVSESLMSYVFGDNNKNEDIEGILQLINCIRNNDNEVKRINVNLIEKNKIIINKKPQELTNKKFRKNIIQIWKNKTWNNTINGKYYKKAHTSTMTDYLNKLELPSNSNVVNMLKFANETKFENTYNNGFNIKLYKKRELLNENNKESKRESLSNKMNIKFKNVMMISNRNGNNKSITKFQNILVSRNNLIKSKTYSLDFQKQNKDNYQYKNKIEENNMKNTYDYALKSAQKNLKNCTIMKMKYNGPYSKPKCIYRDKKNIIYSKKFFDKANSSIKSIIKDNKN